MPRDPPGRTRSRAATAASLQTLVPRSVLDSVAGVQSQSITVDRQMKRYGVPRIAFVNKMDRSGANYDRVATMLKEKLNHHAVRIQVPIGAEDRFLGVIDPIVMKAYHFDGKDGDVVREADIPAEYQETAAERRHEIIEKVSEVDDVLAEKFLARDDADAVRVIRDAIERAPDADPAAVALLDAESDLHLGDAEAARDHALEAVALDGNQAEALIALVETHFRQLEPIGSDSSNSSTGSGCGTGR